MTAYLNATQLRSLADVIDDIDVSVVNAEVEAPDESGRVAVWWDDDTSRHFVRVFDAAENEDLS